MEDFRARHCRAFFCAIGPAYTVHMLWIKAFHIVFVASWFAGLFYLPRIFVLAAETCQRSHRWFRWYNEVPVLLLTAIVILVVVKPF